VNTVRCGRPGIAIGWPFHVTILRLQEQFENREESFDTCRCFLIVELYRTSWQIGSWLLLILSRTSILQFLNEWNEMREGKSFHGKRVVLITVSCKAPQPLQQFCLLLKCGSPSESKTTTSVGVSYPIRSVRIERVSPYYVLD
jgi:hypothetical protein